VSPKAQIRLLRAIIFRAAIDNAGGLRLGDIRRAGLAAGDLAVTAVSRP
jgi:hypothetical protein